MNLFGWFRRDKRLKTSISVSYTEPLLIARLKSEFLEIPDITVSNYVLCRDRFKDVDFDYLKTNGEISDEKGKRDRTEFYRDPFILNWAVKNKTYKALIYKKNKAGVDYTHEQLYNFVKVLIQTSLNE